MPDVIASYGTNLDFVAFFENFGTYQQNSTDCVFIQYTHFYTLHARCNCKSWNAH